MTTNEIKSAMNTRLREYAQFPVENKFQAVLKLELLRKGLRNEKIDASEYSTMCRKCHIPWSDGYFTVEVVPGNKRSRRQIQHLESNRERTKQQDSLIRYLKTRVGRTAKYTCQICSYKTRVPLDGNVKPKPKPKPKPTVLSVAEEREKAYKEWLEANQKRRKRHGKSNAGLKIPPKQPKTTNNTVNNQPSKSLPTPEPKKTSSQFKPHDFRMIQMLLNKSVSAKTDPKQKPMVTQPVGHLRLGRK